jgi:hypothetical protein
MSRFILFLPAAAAVSALLGVGSMSSAQAATVVTASSSAALANVSLNLDGVKLSLGDLVGAQGTAKPLYYNRTTLPAFAKTIGNPLTGSVSVGAGGVVSSAGCTQPVTGRFVAGGTSVTGAVNLSVTTPLGTLLTIGLDGLESHSAFTRYSSGAGVPSGFANITRLRVGLPLLGIPAKSFSGTAKPNQILFQTPDKQVTIYLNRQTITMAAGKPTSITTDAVAVEIGNKTVGALSLSGDIVVGTAMAN